MFLGIDLGTSGIKVVLMDDQQQILATETVAIPISHPRPLWSEQNPIDWWQATEKAVSNLRKNHADLVKRIRAIGLSGQMHGATLLDEKNRVLRPAILWNDGRSFEECEQLKNRVAHAENIIGSMIFPGFTAPKILWLQKNEPEIFKKIAHILLPKDYIRWCLTEEFATDLSDASGTAWLDIAKREWSDEMIAATGITKSQLPKLFEGSQITGKVKTAVADAWRIPHSAVVVGGGGDNATSALSVGVTEPGDAFLSLGTSGVFFAVTDHYQPNPKEAVHLFCHCLPNRWHAMSVHLNAAGCTQWLANLLNQPLETLLAKATGADRNVAPMFLPYLSGERTPYNNPHASGVFFGLRPQTTPEELMLSVLMGVSYALATGLEALKKAKIPLNRMYLLGGGARNLYWAQMLADVLQQSLQLCEEAAVGGAYGAARLARYALVQDAWDHAFAPPHVQKIFTPRAEEKNFYADQFARFKSLYECLKSEFR